GEDEQRRFLMIGPEDQYDLAHFEFVMRAAARIRAAHPRLAEHVSVSLHCEMADILNAYTRIGQKDASLTGLAPYPPARRPPGRPRGASRARWRRPPPTRPAAPTSPCCPSRRARRQRARSRGRPRSPTWPPVAG